MKRRMSVGKQVVTRRMSVRTDLEHEVKEEEAKPARKPAYLRKPSRDVKLQALQMRLAGRTRKEIAEELGLGESYVSNLLYSNSYAELRKSVGL